MCACECVCVNVCVSAQVGGRIRRRAVQEVASGHIVAVETCVEMNVSRWQVGLEAHDEVRLFADKRRAAALPKTS